MFHLISEGQRRLKSSCEMSSLHQNTVVQVCIICFIIIKMQRLNCFLSFMILSTGNFIHCVMKFIKFYHQVLIQNNYILIMIYQKLQRSKNQGRKLPGLQENMPVAWSLTEGKFLSKEKSLCIKTSKCCSITEEGSQRSILFSGGRHSISLGSAVLKLSSKT